MKPRSSKQLENEGTNEGSRQVKNDVTPPTLDSSVLIEIPTEVTMDKNQTEDTIGDTDEVVGQIRNKVGFRILLQQTNRIDGPAGQRGLMT